MAAASVQGKTALITGASAGLGADFARELALHGCHLVLVARREDKLRELQSQLQAAHAVTVRVVPLDLADAASCDRLHESLARDGVVVDILVNNAGVGCFGSFLDLPWDRQAEMLHLNMVTLAKLSHLFGRDMARRGAGYLLQVASIGAYQPSPTYAAYSATKSFVRSFSQALNYELRGSGVSSTVISPGVTATEFLQVAGQRRTWFHNATMMASRDVARIGIEAMLGRRYSVVPGWMNKITAFFTHLTPDPVNAAITYQAMKN